jgi:uncharacterized membrane protein YvlD (DUF360 family)
MDVSKVSRNDWIIGGGFVLMFIGTVAPWYGVDLGFASVTANGWHGSYLGWLTFLLCLAAALVVLRPLVPDLALSLPVPEAVIAVACGGVSALIVVIRIFTKPQFTGLRWGIFVSLVGALVVAVAGFLKYGEVGTPAAAASAPPSFVAPAQAVPPAPQVAAPVQAVPPAPQVAAPVAQPAPAMPAPDVAPQGPPAAAAPATEDRAPVAEQSAAASASRFCIKCGSAFPSPEARFCAKCGTPRQQA